MRVCECVSVYVFKSNVVRTRQGQPKSSIGARRDKLDLKGDFLEFETRMTVDMD